MGTRRFNEGIQHIKKPTLRLNGDGGGVDLYHVNIYQGKQEEVCVQVNCNLKVEGAQMSKGKITNVKGPRNQCCCLIVELVHHPFTSLKLFELVRKQMMDLVGPVGNVD